MDNEHIVHSYDAELNQLQNMIAEMGGLAEMQLARAIAALVVGAANPTELRRLLSRPRADSRPG